MANTVKYNIFLNNQKFKIINKKITTEQPEQSFTIPNVGQADTTSNITLTNGVSATLTLKRNSTGSIGVYFDHTDDNYEIYLLLCYNETQNRYSSGSTNLYIDDEGAINETHNLTINDSFTIYLIDSSPDTYYNVGGFFTQSEIQQVIDNISSYNVLFSVTHASGSNVVVSSNNNRINYDKIIDLNSQDPISYLGGSFTINGKTLTLEGQMCAFGYSPYEPYSETSSATPLAPELSTFYNFRYSLNDNSEMFGILKNNGEYATSSYNCFNSSMSQGFNNMHYDSSTQTINDMPNATLYLFLMSSLPTDFFYEFFPNMITEEMVASFISNYPPIAILNFDSSKLQ